MTWRKKEIAEKVEQDNEEEIIPEIIFAPGCFDHFEGTQEELEALKAEILEMFAGKTSKEILMQSRELSADDVEDLPEEVQQQLLDALNGESGSNRNLH